MKIRALFSFLVIGLLLCAGISREHAQAKQKEGVLATYLAGLKEVKFEPEPLPHYTGVDNGRALYIFQSRKLKTSASGFGGPVDLIIVVTPELFIEKILIEHSNESPQYLKKVEPWLAEFEARPLADFIGPPLPLDAVTQATYTSTAVMETVLRTVAIALGELFEQEKPGLAQNNIVGLGEAIILLLFSFAGIFLFHISHSKKIAFGDDFLGDFRSGLGKFYLCP